MWNKIKNLIYCFLVKSQKYTGTDNIYIAKYGSYLMAGNIISYVAAFLLSVAFARLLPKETYGEYRYILSIMSILAIPSLEGINMAITQAVAKGFEGTFLSGFKTKLKWSLLGSIASIGVAVYFWIQKNADFTLSFLIVAIFLPLFKSGELYQFYLNGKKLFGKRVTYTTIIQILSTSAMILALFLTKRLIVLILVYLFCYSILRIFFLFWTTKKIKPNEKNDPETIKYGKHLSFINVIGLISQQIDNILLFHFVGPAKLAIYSFAALPIEYVRTPFQIIQEISLPKLSVRTEAEIKKTLPQKLLTSILFIVLGIITYVVIAPYFFKIFYPEYLESVFYSRMLAFTLFVFPMSMMALSLQAKMKTKELYKINIFLPIIKIISLVVLTPLYGIMGVVIAILLSQVFQFFITWYFFKKI